MFQQGRRGGCQQNDSPAAGFAKVSAFVEVFGYNTATDALLTPALARLPVGGLCGAAQENGPDRFVTGGFTGATAAQTFNATWVVAVVSLLPASSPLAEVKLDVHYHNTGPPVARPISPIPGGSAFVPASPAHHYLATPSSSSGHQSALSDSDSVHLLSAWLACAMWLHMIRSVEHCESCAAAAPCSPARNQTKVWSETPILGRQLLLPPAN